MRAPPFLWAAMMATLTAGFVLPPVRNHRLSSSSPLQMAKQRNERTSFGVGKGWEARWEKMYHLLRAERSWNPGSKNLEYAENPKLWLWLNIQKENLRRDAIRQDRKEKLAAMGYATTVAPVPANATDFLAGISYQDYFPPTPPTVARAVSAPPANTTWEKRWDDMYTKLALFQKKFGHTQVKGDIKLSNWVIIQKENLRRGVMKPDRRERLRKLGLTVKDDN